MSVSRFLARSTDLLNNHRAPSFHFTRRPDPRKLSVPVVACYLQHEVAYLSRTYKGLETVLDASVPLQVRFQAVAKNVRVGPPRLAYSCVPCGAM